MPPDLSFRVVKELSRVVGSIFMSVVRDLRLLSYSSMDIDVLYINLKLNIRAI